MSGQRIPNTSSPTELRQAWQRTESRAGILSGGASNYILVGQGIGVAPVWQTIVSTIDHGTDLAGLDGDDHTQYHTDARGDARYYTETELNAGQLDGQYFQESEFLASSAGAGDAGKPIKLDATGKIDSTMVGVTTDEKVGIDAAATAGYIGAAFNDGILRTSTGISYADGGDFVTLTTNDGEIAHDSLSGYDANKHVDHTGVSISSGIGLTGGGAITSTQTLSLSHLGIQSLTDPNADRIMFWDDVGAAAVTWLTVSTGLQIATTNLTTKDSEIVHDNLSGYDANDHIDHSGVSISSGSGLTGGGAITTTQTLALDINGLAATGIAAGDFIPFWDITATATNKKITFANFEGTLSHNSLADYVAAEHIDWTGASDNFNTSGYMRTGAYTIEEVSADTNRLGIQSGNTGTYAMVDIYSKDGDGSDNVGIAIFSTGTPTDWSSWAWLSMKWDQAALKFSISTSGSGTPRKLDIFVGANAGQLLLDNNGGVSIRNWSFVASGGYAGRLGIQNTTTGTYAIVDIYAGSGDGTDNVGLSIWAKGKTDDWTPYELLSLKWDQAASEFSIGVLVSGAGSGTQPLNIFTSGNSGQVYLKDDGNTGINNSNPTRTLDITGTLAVSGNCTFSGTGHDSFTDMVANEHIDHTGVTLTAGSGIAGGGTIAANRSFDLDINSLAAAAIASGDFVPFWDITATATNKKITFTNFEAALTHDNLIAGTIADHDTTATGANLTSLTDNSMVDALHRHSELSASDGTPDAIVSIDAAGQFGHGTASPQEYFHIYNSSGDHTRLELEATTTGWAVFKMTVAGPYSKGWYVTLGGDLGLHDYQTAKNMAVFDDPGQFGIGEDIVPDARLEVETTATEGKQAVTIDQNDIDKAFIDFQGESEAGAAKNISSWTAGNTIQGFIKQEVNGAEVWMPYYDAPTS